MEGRNITRLNSPASAPVAKRVQFLALVNNTRGQISIFFSASLVVLITIIAFVINIGLFVKAKINLQNATDAAAFAGAAVQARQLSTIGYLNWEMRNIYKEWMYKYYVVGNLNIKDVESPPTGGAMSFRLDPGVNVLENVGSPFRATEDKFNIPAICIHTEGSRTNICRRYAVPGLPEFGNSNLPGAEEASRAFMDALIQGKVLDCGERTALNSLVSATWAYNVLSNDSLDATLTGRGPAVLANRQGAWPQAVELAMRMRNLEFAMNRPAETTGVCIGGGGSTSKTNCNRPVSDFGAAPVLGNERLVKAFYSGYRNLGNDVDDEMKKTFTLTEIPPKEPELGGDTSASYLLVPSNNKYKKQYVDLKLMMINLATFYGAMIPTAERGASGRTGTSGECVISKVATPVPGYPLGFYKNPEVVTYYAVRGEAEFVGMFNPFGSEPIKLTTYSAAKPMGGRIGPMLFTQKRDFFTGRNDRGKFRSVPYLTSLEFAGTRVRDLMNRSFRTLTLGDFIPGVPIPINTSSGSDGYFWVENSDKPVGGRVTDGTIQFGIPNIVYDYDEPFSSESYTLSNEKIHKIDTSRDKDADQAVGLFSASQFQAFKGNRIGTVATTQQLLEEEIGRIRAPTLYEAANYLVPTPNDFNISKKIDSFGFIAGTPTALPNNVSKYTSYVYAPLYSRNGQQDVLWQSQSEVISTIFEFLRAQKAGIDKYRRSMNIVAKQLASVATYLESGSAPARGSAQAYRLAAAQIADLADLSATADPNQKAKSCKSLVGSFLFFYYGANDLFPKDYVVDNVTGCPKTLGDQLVSYFSQTDANSGFSPTHYKFEYFWKPDNFPKAPHTPEKSFAVFSGYQPGPFTGVEASGQFVNPITDDSNLELMRRNFYSTKFVALDSLQNNDGYNQQVNAFAIYSEGTTENSESDSDTYQKEFKNSLNADALGIDLSTIKY